MIFVVISVLFLPMIDYSCGFSCDYPEKHRYYVKNKENEIVEVDFEKNITIKGTFPFNRPNAKFNYAEQLSPDKVLISYNVENERKLELVNPYGNGTEIKVDENISLEFGVSFPVDENIFHCYKHRCFRLVGDEFKEVEEMKVPTPADSTEGPRYPFVITYGKMVCLLGGGQKMQSHTETWCLDRSKGKWVANETMPTIGGRKFYWAHAIHDDALVVCTLKYSPFCMDRSLRNAVNQTLKGGTDYEHMPTTPCKMGDMSTLKYCSEKLLVSVAGRGIVGTAIFDGLVSQSSIIPRILRMNVGALTDFIQIFNEGKTQMYVSQISGPIIALQNCFDKWQPRNLTTSANFSLTSSFAPLMKASNTAKTNNTAFYVLGTLFGLFLVFVIVFVAIRFIRKRGELKSESRTMSMMSLSKVRAKPDSNMTVGKENKAVLMKGETKSESGQTSLMGSVRVSKMAVKPRMGLKHGPIRLKPAGLTSSGSSVASGTEQSFSVGK